ncbi:hypothetical protein [Longimicrobium sp.]|uniref:hypothetical protein n=1 Tax=Longimicrobium sp. TaxID=2029185 RepID=UPI002B6FC886|nr:hypothetical protein [Longimicrobium sp.]HSU15817.1 hypothetical protein [Longimicrobium sp.]
MKRGAAAVLLMCTAAGCAPDRAVAPAPAQVRPTTAAERLSAVQVTATATGLRDSLGIVDGLIVDGPREFVRNPRVVLDGRVVHLRRDDPRIRRRGVAAAIVFTRAEVGDRFGPGDYDSVVVIRTPPCDFGQRLGECIGIPIPPRPTPILDVAAERTP